MNSPLNVGLVGFGNIGSGVLRALKANGDAIERRAGRPIRVARIVDQDVDRPRDAAYDPAQISTDADTVLRDSAIGVVLELTGTIDFARELIERALTAGKHVVTANKALLAIHGAELFRTAAAHNVCLLFEATVGGGIPVIRTLRRDLAANDIMSVRGVLNGTCNYILTQMSEEGMDLPTALREAQALGYAEPDPSYDVQGIDTAHKLAILAMLCFDQEIRFDDIHVEGIEGVQPVDLDHAHEQGYAVKLIGIARRCQDDDIDVRVHPALVPAHTPLGSVPGVFNAVCIDGNLTGPITLIGRGAGPDPTSSAILSDLMALASEPDRVGSRPEMRPPSHLERKRVRAMSDVRGRNYVRLHLADEAGVTVQVVQCFERHGIGVTSMSQPVMPADHREHTLIMTDEAREGDVEAALASLRGLRSNRGEPFLLRVEAMS